MKFKYRALVGEIQRGEPKYSEKVCPSATFFSTEPVYNYVGSYVGP